MAKTLKNYKKKTAEFVKEKKKVIANDDAFTYFTKWMTTPAYEIPNMFAVFDSSTFNTQRAVTYQVSNQDLTELMKTYENMLKSKNKKVQAQAKTAVLRFYLGCNPNYNNGQISMGSPAFNPFVKLEFEGDTAGPFDNCYKLNWVADSGVRLGHRVFVGPPNADNVRRVYRYGVTNVNGEEIPQSDNSSEISPETATLFIVEWCNCTDNELAGAFSGIVFSEVARVKSYQFTHLDLEDIYARWLKNKEQVLKLHLAIVQPKINTPFGFHLVLQISPLLPLEQGRTKSNRRRIVNDDSDDSNGAFYDFSYPCPPYCGNGSGG